MTIKELTADNHNKAENMPFNQKLMRGGISEKEYIAYLRSQYAIFSTIESLFWPEKLPYADMCRGALVLEDLNHLMDSDHTEVGEKTTEYCEYIKQLNVDRLTSHIYLNYMAVMMGGQIIKKNVPGIGNMYNFGDAEKVRDIAKLIRSCDLSGSEINKGYEYIIAILDELQGYSG